MKVFGLIKYFCEVNLEHPRRVEASLHRQV